MNWEKTKKKSINSPTVQPKKNCEEAITYNADNSVCSYVSDNIWDFRETIKAGLTSKTTISFVKINKKYRYDIQKTIKKLNDISIRKTKRSLTISTLDSYKKGLFKIAKAMESTNWSLLNIDMHYRLFLHNLREAQYSPQTTNADILPTLNILCDFDIISRRIPSSKLLESTNNKKSIQHIAIPLKMYISLLQGAISIVEKYHPYRHEISEIMAKAYDIKTQISQGKIYAHHPINSTPLSYSKDAVKLRSIKVIKKIKHNIPEFKITFTGSELSKIQSACLVVILAFTGMRLGEALTLTIGSYNEKKFKKDKVLSYVTGESTKSFAGIATSVSWATHPFIKNVIELAYYSTQFLREMYHLKTKESYENKKLKQSSKDIVTRQLASIFITVNPSIQQAGYIASNFNRKIPLLAKQLGVKPTCADIKEFEMLNPDRVGQLKINGVLPKLSPHDFRRTFAVFFVRYGFGNASAIKFQYKHRNIDMSDYYTNHAELAKMHDHKIDIELCKLLDEEAINFGIDTWDSIYNDSIYLSGAAGEKLFQEKTNALANGTSVFMSREEIERLVRDKSLSLVQLPSGGYCTNASCDRLCSMMTLDRVKCQYRLVDDTQAQLMAQRRLRLIEKFQRLNQGDSLMSSMLIAIKQEIATIENYN